MILQEGVAMSRGWNLWRELDDLRREVDRVFDGFGSRRRGQLPAAFLPGRAARAYPLMNVYEDPAAVTVEALAPGLDPDSLGLSVRDHTLVLEGEKPGPGEVPAEAYHRRERATGTFVRTLPLETEIDADRVEAKYENGILTVTLPKSESAQPKRIPVDVS
jgi:HSP20 family protein